MFYSYANRTRAIASEDQCSYPYLRLDILNSPILHKIWKCNVMLHIIPFSIMIVTHLLDHITNFIIWSSSRIYFQSFLLVFSIYLRENIFVLKFELISKDPFLLESLQGWYPTHDSLPFILPTRRLVLRIEFLWI